MPSPLSAIKSLFSTAASGGVARTAFSGLTGVVPQTGESLARAAIRPRNAPWTLLGLGAGKEIVADPIYGALKTDPLDQEFEFERAYWQERERARLAQEQRHRDIATNIATLAATYPDIYNRVMAGRRLPDAAVPFGGQPRTDLLETLAAKMADGGFGPDPSDSADLLSSL